LNLKNTYKAGALFAGIGGFCLGFVQSEIKTVWAVEYDDSAVLTYKRNLQNVRVLNEDIREVHVANHDLEPVDVLHAGFPCQSFSQAGSRKGFADERGKLFYEITRIIKEFKDKKPSVLVLENSPYLRHGDSGTWFLELTTEIKKTGYWFRDTNCAELDAYYLSNLPQKRNRLFMVAFSIDKFSHGKLDFPSQKWEGKKDLSKFINFQGQLDDKSYYLDSENRYFNMISKHADNCADCIYQLRKYFVRVKDPSVCPTLTANMGQGGHNVPFIFDAHGLRKLTEHECLKLQGFPEEFTFPENVTRPKRYIQIGNSVAVPVAALLAEKIKSKMEKELGNA
jgi:DNA (cytosine-5)-methyltransferase 1